MPTETETRLARLSGSTFLSLWSYPSPFRDQKQGAKGDGKELCDLMVVFGSHILLFSDKNCQFRGADLQVAWRRWHRKAIEKSQAQLRGAERWLKQYPQRVFSDRSCTKPLPTTIPSTPIFHRILVANGAAEACRSHLGGSGSLMTTTAPTSRPFAVCNGDKHGFFHVFDEVTIDIVLKHLNTVADFIDYLAAKERLARGVANLRSTGEEELLAHYLTTTDANGAQCFPWDPNSIDYIVVPEGGFANLQQSAEYVGYQAQVKASRLWDELIELFARDALAGTLAEQTHGLAGAEKLLRVMAAERRLARCAYSRAVQGWLDQASADAASPSWRVIFSQDGRGVAYVFLNVPLSYVDISIYEQVRQLLLLDYCRLLCLEREQIHTVVGIAITARDGPGFETAVLHEREPISAAEEAELREFQKQFGVLTDTRSRERRFSVSMYDKRHTLRVQRNRRKAEKRKARHKGKRKP